jgi:hypothetical protein
MKRVSAKEALLSPASRRVSIRTAYAFAEVTLQELGPGVKGYLHDDLSSAIWKPMTERLAV